MNRAEQKNVIISRRSGVGTGTTSLLMIFTVLCFATLAMLSLATAASSQRTQQRGFEKAAATAAARGEVAGQVALLDEQLLALQLEHQDDAAAYMDSAAQLAQQLGWAAGEQQGSIVWIQGVDEETELYTELILLEQDAAERYTVELQVAQVIGGWSAEDDGQIWQGA